MMNKGYHFEKHQSCASLQNDRENSGAQRFCPDHRFCAELPPIKRSHHFSKILGAPNSTNCPILGVMIDKPNLSANFVLSTIGSYQLCRDKVNIAQWIGIRFFPLRSWNPRITSSGMLWTAFQRILYWPLSIKTRSNGPYFSPIFL